MNENQFRIAAIILGIALAILIIILFFIMFGGGGDDDAAATTTTSSGETTTSEGETTTSEGETTTSDGETTTTVADTTTTTVEETTTTEATTTTTTVAPIVLERDGLGGIDFGASPDAAIAYVTAALASSPTSDSGWVDSFSVYGTCPPPVVRGVEWGRLVLLFTRAATGFASEGTEHLFSYYYTGNDAPAAGLGTDESIFVGSTRNELDAAYGGSLEVFDEEFGTIWHVDRDPGSWEALYGYLSGPLPADLVESINGGRGCGE